ncbi:MAG TPA: hypothetical protein VF350_04910 [Candidatus Bathyarchaeia archaeon]
MRGQYVFNPPYLILAVALILVTGVGFIVTYLSGKSYLATGSLVLLFFSMAFIVQSIVPIGSGLASLFSPSATVAIAALGLLVGSLIQLIAAVQASFRSVSIGSEHRKIRLTIASAVSLLLSFIVVFLPLLPSFPLLFIDAAGVTLINQAIYVIAIAFFVAGGLLFMRLYLHSKSSPLYWYSLALLLWGVGTFGVMWQLRFSDIVAWTGRCGWYIGSLYYIIALRSAKRGTN